MTVLSRILAVCLFAWFGLSAPLAQETIVLTTPVVTTTTLTGWTPKRLTIIAGPQPVIEIVLTSSTGIDETFRYPCQAGECATTTDTQVATIITTLNTANLATRSLWRRIFDRLVADFPSRFPGGATVK